MGVAFSSKKIIDTFKLIGEGKDRSTYSPTGVWEDAVREILGKEVVYKVTKYHVVSHREYDNWVTHGDSGLLCPILGFYEESDYSITIMEKVTPLSKVYSGETLHDIPCQDVLSYFGMDLEDLVGWFEDVGIDAEEATLLCNCGFTEGGKGVFLDYADIW